MKALCECVLVVIDLPLVHETNKTHRIYALMVEHTDTQHITGKLTTLHTYTLLHTDTGCDGDMCVVNARALALMVRNGPLFDRLTYTENMESYCRR